MQNKKITRMAFFTALALIFSYIETLIPFNIGIPGVKLGLANIIAVWAIYVFGFKEAVAISFLRIVLSGFLFGNVFGIIYSLSGATLSLIVMGFLKETNLFHCITISIYGGVFHNIGQIIVAMFIVENYKISYYIPVLMIVGTFTGLLIGIVSFEILTRTMSVFKD
ncbi:Gx transporter family protein [Lachnobacterium bovis]|uniref:Heptaprenyl diphosphate synthase n=1 Tax=Lachnobacterium bovis TaxID=140626 RepID=A0A1H9QMU6_9FIRM|nr:Gx transporter family protein [Lachnobacterium bovis]SER61774.1 heptaprenyl diphosphate synthase [Lachnobacterium bovis]